MEKETPILFDNKQLANCADAAYWYEKTGIIPKSLKDEMYFRYYRWQTKKPKVSPLLTASVVHKQSDRWSRFETGLVAFNDGTRKIVVNIETRALTTGIQRSTIPDYCLDVDTFFVFAALYAKSKGWKKVWLYRDYDYEGDPIALIGNRKECCGGPADRGAVVDTEIIFEH
jgi:hypothetical protein